MKKAKKTDLTPQKTKRFFFTATLELGEWIDKEAKNIGLETPEFLRMKMHSLMKKEVSDAAS